AALRSGKVGEHLYRGATGSRGPGAGLPTAVPLFPGGAAGGRVGRCCRPLSVQRIDELAKSISGETPPSPSPIGDQQLTCGMPQNSRPYHTSCGVRRGHHKSRMEANKKRNIIGWESVVKHRIGNRL